MCTVYNHPCLWVKEELSEMLILETEFIKIDCLVNSPV